MKSKLIGEQVYITDKESIYCGEWGTIRDYDGDVYYIAIADDSNNLPVFNRNQFWMPRKKRSVGERTT